MAELVKRKDRQEGLVEEILSQIRDGDIRAKRSYDEESLPTSEGSEVEEEEVSSLESTQESILSTDVSSQTS